MIDEWSAPGLSAHGIGLRDRIATALLTCVLPDVHLIAVSNGSHTAMSVELSDEVRASLPGVAEAIHRIMALVADKN